MKNRIIQFCTGMAVLLGSMAPGVSMAQSCKIGFGLEKGGLDFTPVSAFQSTQSSFIEGHFAERLLSLHQNGKLVLHAAQAFEVQHDEKTVTFTLNPTCRWSDGKAITAKDFQAGISYAVYANGGDLMSGIRGAKEFIKSADLADLAITAPAPDILKIGYDGSSDLLLINLGISGMTPFPLHSGLSPEAYFSLPLEKRITSGVYVVQRRNAQSMVLARNPYYCQGAQPPIDRVEFHLIDDPEQRVRQFVQGKLDVLRFLPAKQLQGVLQRNKDIGIQFLPNGNLAHMLLLLNAKHAGLSDIRVRKAIELALDYQAFLEAGSQNPTQTRMRSKGYTLVYPPYVNEPMQIYFSARRQDVAKARSLMEAAGYTQDNPLEITLTTYPIPGYVTTARRVASMLRRAHFRVTYKAQETTLAALEANAQGDFELFIRGASPVIPDTSAVLSELWAAAVEIVLEGMQTRSADLEHMRQRLPVLLEKASLSDKTQERVAAMVEVENLIGESKLVIPLFDMVRNFTARAEFKPGEHGFGSNGTRIMAQYWTKEGCE